MSPRAALTKHLLDGDDSIFTGRFDNPQNPEKPQSGPGPGDVKPSAPPPVPPVDPSAPTKFDPDAT